VSVVRLRQSGHRVCLVGTDLPLPAAYGCGLGRLVEDFHRRSEYPYSLAWTLDQLAKVPAIQTHRLYVILEVSGDRAQAVGYAWAEVLLTGEFWLHQVYVSSSYSLRGEDSPAMLLWDRLRSDALEAGCSRISGVVHRGVDAARAYCRRWGAEIQAVIVTQHLGGDHGRRTGPYRNERRNHVSQ
jgi:hypothetical protein